MAHSWNIETLKEHFEAILSEKDKALAAALIAVKEENRKTEVAAEKRFELLNELRSGVATREQLDALEKVVDDLKSSRDTGQGKGVGVGQGWAMATGVVLFAIAVAGFVITKLS
jgi:hypothetical protein